MKRVHRFTRRALQGDEQLWKIWWLGAIPVAAAATALTLGAELLRDEGFHAYGAILDILKLLAYAAWFIAAWRCSRNAGNPLWATLNRMAIACGVVAAALTI